MTQRSMLAGTKPVVIVKAGANVMVKGHDSDRVIANSEGRWGLKIEKHSAAQIGRARAVIGEHVLFDVSLMRPRGKNLTPPEEVIEVQLGSSGRVWVPFNSSLKVYSGKDCDVQAVRGQVDAYAGFNLSLQDVYCLSNASAGRAMSLDCQTMLADNAEFTAGRDLRFHILSLTSARIRVNDIGGYWEARIGDGEKSVYLKSGGDVTLVTDQKVEALPPNYVLGNIEKPTRT